MKVEENLIFFLTRILYLAHLLFYIWKLTYQKFFSPMALENFAFFSEAI